MSHLHHWLTHRAKIVRLAWPEGVAELAGVSPNRLDDAARGGGLAGIGRGARGFLARALKVSVRELEALADGRIKWIDDGRLIDLDRRSPNAVQAFALSQPKLVFSPSHLGIPIVGRICESGVVENLNEWSAEDGPRLAVRSPEVPDAFAIRLERPFGSARSGDYLIFANIVPGQMNQSEIVLLADIKGESKIGIVHSVGKSTASMDFSSLALGELITIEFSGILRAARVIACASPDTSGA